MDKRDLREYATAHQNCQVLGDIIDKLEDLVLVVDENSDDVIGEIIISLRSMQNTESNYRVNFESDFCNKKEY